MYVKEEPHDNDLDVSADPLLLPPDVKAGNTEEAWHVKSEPPINKWIPYIDMSVMKKEPSLDNHVSKCYILLQC